MTNEEAIIDIRENIQPIIGGKSLDIAISALEKQIPKKPYKVKEHKQNDYYCVVCKCYLGDETELKYACLQPKYCENCGQALKWSDSE